MLLTDLGDIATQKTILGAEYESVYERIHGVAVRKPAPFPLGDAAGALNRVEKRSAGDVDDDAEVAPSLAKKVKTES
jgi:hypothetical protein